VTPAPLAQHLQILRMTGVDSDACLLPILEVAMKKNSGIHILAAASSLALIALAGCDNPKPAETAGKKIDQAMDKMAQKVDQVAERAKEQGEKASQAMDDTKITAAVKAKILTEPGLKVLKIDVDTKDGFVTLSGSADSDQDVQKATQIASAIQGVKSVDNRLAISSKG
jgi:hyperosmotically inducible protein